MNKSDFIAPEEARGWGRVFFAEIFVFLVAAATAAWFAWSVGFTATEHRVPFIQTPSGHGSGILLKNGLILTAAHVLDDSGSVAVKFGNDKEYPRVEVLWSNKDYDVALLDTGDTKLSSSHKITCDALTVGTKIHAIGHPAMLREVHTWGQVANENIQRQSSWKAAMVVNIQFVGGMSGGPVLDEYGRVVGITVADLANSAIGLVVPMKTVCKLMGGGNT